MASLAESMWASIPDTPSVSAGQNTNKRSRETQNTETPSRGAHANRRRGRGGGSAKPAQQSTPSDAHTPTSRATEPSTTTASEPGDIPPTPATPRNAPNKKVKPEGHRNHGRAAPAAAAAKTPPPEKDENVISAAASNDTRRASKKRSNKVTSGAKRKAPLTIPPTNEPLSTIIEPAAPLSQSGGAIPSSVVPEDAIAAPDSPKTTSHSSGPETLPPSTPGPDQEHQLLKPLPAVVPDTASIRPLTPASTSHIDWADDDDADDLPDLDDWGFIPGRPDTKPQAQRRRSSSAKAGRQEVAKSEQMCIPFVSEDPPPHRPKVLEITTDEVAAKEGSTKPAENAPAAAAAPPKPAQARYPLTEAQIAERKRLQNQKTRERRKIKRLASNEAGAHPNPKPSLESQLGVQGIASQIRKLDDGKAAPSTPTPKVAVSSSPNTPAPLPPKPTRASPPAKPTPSSDKLLNSTPAKTLPQSPRSPSSLPARPSLPPTASSAPPSNTIPPRRKPFGGEPAFNMGGQPRNSKGHISDDLRAGRRERPPSAQHAHSVSRPVISQSALSQLTKSLSGGNRTHHPTVTAE